MCVAFNSCQQLRSTGFSASTSNFLCQCHSAIEPHPYSCRHYSYHKDKRSKPGNFETSNAFWILGGGGGGGSSQNIKVLSLYFSL